MGMAIAMDMARIFGTIQRFDFDDAVGVLGSVLLWGICLDLIWVGWLRLRNCLLGGTYTCQGYDLFGVFAILLGTLDIISGIVDIALDTTGRLGTGSNWIATYATV